MSDAYSVLLLVMLFTLWQGANYRAESGCQINQLVSRLTPVFPALSYSILSIVILLLTLWPGANSGCQIN